MARRERCQSCRRACNEGDPTYRGRPICEECLQRVADARAVEDGEEDEHEEDLT